MIRGRGFFVTATDTGVGKTRITAGLARALGNRGYRVGVMKPVQSGHLREDPAGDGMLLKEWSGVSSSIEEVAPYCWPTPVAPGLAAQMAGESLDRSVLLERVEKLAEKWDVLLIEGAGGWFVPMGEGWTIADLAVDIGWPTLIVARPGLGTVNHTALTSLAIRARGLEPAGVILNGLKKGDRAPDLPHNPRLIEEVAKVPVLGAIPWGNERPTAVELKEEFQQDLPIDRLVHLLDDAKNWRGENE
ncbi:dethiobiotin synthetase [Marininema mesophilum]|uniref:ATP-dependent dethiobiotin synthetase BioD n=1 Tax=Marininema mesophilum TaxID=1048340 RepID=A0A1H2W7Z3_9BACL|nr:dethiobiotin synthase [Marininema mesophilum]SDW76169.1 dethiobiotin synthetase [Marininema mesophilum]